MMFHFRGDQDRLTAEGAARMIWDDLLQHVGIESA
jgi:hypothetical protein